MEPTSNPTVIYRKGERVRHPKMPKWGLGEVLARSNGTDVKVFFVGIGYKVLSLSFVTLEKVPPLIAESPLLDNLIHDIANSTTKYQTFEDTLTLFQKGYNDGFYDAAYLSGEREAKENSHREALALLNEEALGALLDEGNAVEVCERALAIVNQTSMVFPNEKAALKKALSTQRAQIEFAESLQAVLYSDVKMRTRFDEFAHTLTRLGVSKWQVATYLLHVIQPHQHMFVKPTIMQQTAEQSGFNIQYAATVNWKTYDHVLRFSEYLFNELKATGLHPRDMIDVQSFMWCVTLGKFAEADK